jgi:hypothetical protein
MSTLGPGGSEGEPLRGDRELQFERAEYTGGSTGPTCCTCQQPAIPEYHQFNGRVFCTSCRFQIEHSMEQLHQSGSLGRAFLFGLGAAAVGSLIFYAVSALTGYEFGLIAVLVGWMVGKAVRKGSGSTGGWRYQALAMALTYISIVSTAIPGIVASAHSAQTGTIEFYLFVFAVALASPVLGGLRNILGIIIIGIGLWEAWKFNRRVEVKFTGPFSVKT